MASQLPLPKPDALPESVLFHRELPAGERLIMQLPNEDNTDAETWVLYLEKFEHKAWLGCLKNNRELLDLLMMEEHVAYCPRTGYVEAIPDLDMPTPTQLLVSYARMQAEGTFSPELERRVHAREIRRRTPLISTIRLGLMHAGRRLFGGKA